jgi:hypothetical protein
MVSFKATILKYNEKGEKTGWTYFDIPADIAGKIKPRYKKSFRVKGTLDDSPVHGIALLPVGNGNFIMPLNKDLRKLIGKRHGAVIMVRLEEDTSDFHFNNDFMECLSDDQEAMNFFKSLALSHQKYFSKWIDSAKTEATKEKRIAMALNALSRKLGYGEMLRLSKSI